MTIRELITRGKGATHGWRVDRVERNREDGWATLAHYSTPLLTWNTKRPSEHEVLSTGWGSVSDQNGLNTAFRALGIAKRYDRDQRGGGARITELTQHACGCITDPSITTCTCSRNLELITGVSL